MRSIVFSLLISFLWGNTPLAAANSIDEHVVLLHGIARSTSHMKDLEGSLQKQGYNVINLDYPSTDHTLEQLVEPIHKKLSVKLTENKPVHFVRYSMGGLLVRAVIHKHKPTNLGRVVQLAPPNNGNEVADFLKNNWVYQKIYGPAGQQLTTDKDLTDLLGKIDYELGVIAGNSTKLKGMKDHVIVSPSHTFFPSNKTVHRQKEYFLKYAVFKKESGK